MFCGYCGKQIKDGNSFCPNCGSSLLPPSAGTPDDPSDNEQEDIIIFPDEQTVFSQDEVITPPAEQPAPSQQYQAPLQPYPAPAPQYGAQPAAQYNYGAVQTPAQPLNVTVVQPRPISEFDLPAQYRPLGAWAYFGYTLLFCIPLVGFILLIVFSVSDSNINRRNYARSYWCILVIALAIVLTMVLFGVGLGVGLMGK